MEFDPANGLPQVTTDFKLNGSLTIPSAVHGYSIAIEYMKNWFLKKFDETYFKTVYLNGKNIIDDYRRYSIFSNIKREKPMLAIVPTINLEYDRNGLDLYQWSDEILVRSFNFNEAFFADPTNNIYLGFNVRELEMNFSFRARVSTKAQQLDLYRYMEMKFRIGSTQTEWVSVDYHIPNEMIINLASHAGFEVNKETGAVSDVYGFLNYANAHSKFPIVYKMRAINGNCEYFFRVSNVYAWVSTQDKLSDDGGEMDGKIESNFEVSMNTTLHIHVPHFFVYYSKETNIKYIPPQDSNVFGLFTFKIFQPPEENSLGWGQYVVTDYELDANELKQPTLEISIADLFPPDLQGIIKDHIQKGISPSSFIDFCLYNFEENATKTLSWEEMKIIIPSPQCGVIHIAIYVDMLYYNEQMVTLKQTKTSRLN